MIDPRPGITDYAIEPTKISGYLLDLAHCDGASKAAIFLAHNFTAETLPVTLIDHATSGEWANTRVRSFGYVFEIRGGVLTPIGRALVVRAAWAVYDDRPSVAKLVTAYPA